MVHLKLKHHKILANAFALKSEPTFKFSIPSVVQNLFIANGKSIETTITSALSTFAASSLNFLVSAAQTAVSKEGTTTTI